MNKKIFLFSILQLAVSINFMAGGVFASSATRITAFPEYLVLYAIEGAAAGQSQTFTVANGGTGTLNFTLAESTDWFEISKTSGSVTADKADITQNGEQQIIAKDVFFCSISPNKKYILCIDKDSIYSYNVNNSQLNLLMKDKNSYYLSADIWSPDGKYFLFTKLRKVKFTFNIFKYWNDMVAEIRDLYVYCLTTGEEKKLLIIEISSAGFG